MSGIGDDLRHKLSAYQPVGPRDERFVERMLALLDVGAPAFRQDSYLPGHFTASAFILAPVEPSLLLILHAKLGLWLQPGGHVEPTDADLVAAARREAEEEAGLVGLELVHPGILDVDIHSIPARAPAPAHQHFDVRFLFRARSTELRAASDARAARWAPLASLSTEGSDDSVMRAVERIRALGR
jgi:8-oxo-dGTP pyrophosphatase MutT (NUDIX family)